MNADIKNKAAGAIKIIWSYAKISFSISLRWIRILGKYILICWQQQRLRRAQRRLGGAVQNALEQGEVNPMLTEAVKDALEKTKAIKTKKDKYYQAIDALRDEIHSTCACAAGE